MKTPLIRGLLALSLFALAACQPESQSTSAPEQSAPKDGFVYNSGEAYLIWKTRDANAPVKPIWFCRSGVRMIDRGCGYSQAPWVQVGGVNKNIHSLKLPDGGAIHLAELSFSGDYFPAYTGSAGGVPSADFTAPVFKFELARTTYAGTYQGGPGLFRSGDWDPAGLRADLESIGRGDIAKWVRADRPQGLKMRCSNAQCEFGGSQGPFQGYQVISE